MTAIILNKLDEILFNLKQYSLDELKNKLEFIKNISKVYSKDDLEYIADIEQLIKSVISEHTGTQLKVLFE